MCYRADLHKSIIFVINGPQPFCAAAAPGLYSWFSVVVGRDRSRHCYRQALRGAGSAVIYARIVVAVLPGCVCSSASDSPSFDCMVKRISFASVRANLRQDSAIYLGIKSQNLASPMHNPAMSQLSRPTACKTSILSAKQQRFIKLPPSSSKSLAIAIAHTTMAIPLSSHCKLVC